MHNCEQTRPHTSLVTFNCLLLSSQCTQHRANWNTPDNGYQEGEFQRSITFPYLVMFGCGSAITTGVQSHSIDNSLVPRPFPAPVLIACSIKTEGKAWEKESRA